MKTIILTAIIILAAFTAQAQTNPDTVLSPKRYQQIWDTITSRSLSQRYQMRERFYDGFKQPRHECIIDGKRFPYNACGEGDLDAIKKSYHAFYYIGSGYVIFINGVESISDKLTHFFY